MKEGENEIKDIKCVGNYREENNKWYKRSDDEKEG